MSEEEKVYQVETSYGRRPEDNPGYTTKKRGVHPMANQSPTWNRSFFLITPSPSDLAYLTEHRVTYSPSIPNMATSQDIIKLFVKIESQFENTSFGADHWYIATIAALAGGNDPELCKDLYLHLISKPEYSTPQQRQALIRRLREALVKCVSIIGVCKPLEAILAIGSCEAEEDKDYTASRENWQCDEGNLKRGRDWLGKIYTGDASSTLGLFAAHKDFIWISENITYGLYLSDRQSLGDIETELVVLPGIMIQNLPKETSWHIRGIRRIGVSFEDTQVVWNCVQLVAEYLGMKLHRVPTVIDVEKEV